MGKNWIYPYIYGVDVGGGGSVDKMDKICFCLCCALQPVSKSAGVSRGLVGWGRIGYIHICAKHWDVLPITVIVSLIMIVIINDGSNGNNHMT